MKPLLVTRSQIDKTIEVYLALDRGGCGSLNIEGDQCPSAFQIAEYLSRMTAAGAPDPELNGFQVLRDAWADLDLYCHTLHRNEQDAEAAMAVYSAHILGRCADKPHLERASRLDGTTRAMSFLQLASPPASILVAELALCCRIQWASSESG